MSLKTIITSWLTKIKNVFERIHTPAEPDPNVEKAARRLKRLLSGRITRGKLCDIRTTLNRMSDVEQEGVVNMHYRMLLRVEEKVKRYLEEEERKANEQRENLPIESSDCDDCCIRNCCEENLRRWNTADANYINNKLKTMARNNKIHCGKHCKNRVVENPTFTLPRPTSADYKNAEERRKREFIQEVNE
ncbi:hypothetical protein COBT_003458, partial [Conglomerata obtusa]